MFWDKVAPLYELFENIYNGKVNRQLCIAVEQMIDEGDEVLECACGTGMLSRAIAKRASNLIATDFSEGMLQQARKKCALIPNITIDKADITSLSYADNSFDKVVAGNVIHLLDHPEIALSELMRVCKQGGEVIIPTYVNNENTGKQSLFVTILHKLGAGFKCQFDYPTYRHFFAEMGYDKVDFSIVRGKMPCAIAKIRKP